MTAINIRVYSGDDARHGATLAIDHQLNINGWQLRPRLYTVKAGDQRAIVGLAFKDEIPVSVVLLRIEPGYEDIAAFTRKSERRQGIASMIIDAMRKTGAVFPQAEPGIIGSERFWRQNNINCPQDAVTNEPRWAL